MTGSMNRRRFSLRPLAAPRTALIGVLSLFLAFGAAGAGGATAFAGDTNSLQVSGTTTSGIHNTYDPSAFTYLAQGLDTGTSMIELDVWDDFFTQEWKVSHSSLTSNGNNCVNASSAADLYTGSANKNLESCLDDVRVWLGAHPATGR